MKRQKPSGLLRRDGWNCHHFLFEYVEQDVNPKLHNHIGMVALLPITLHDELHRKIPPPPVPSKWLAQKLIMEMNYADGGLKEKFSAALNTLGDICIYGACQESTVAGDLLTNLERQQRMMREAIDI